MCFLITIENVKKYATNIGRGSAYMHVTLCARVLARSTHSYVWPLFSLRNEVMIILFLHTESIHFSNESKVKVIFFLDRLPNSHIECCN